MALNAAALAAKLQNEMRGLTVNAWEQFGKSTGEYIQQNAVVTYGWAASNETGEPDPATSFTQASISGAIGIPQPANWPMFALLLDQMILRFTINAPGAWSITPGKFAGTMGLNIAQMMLTNTFEDAMLKIATAIVTGVKMMVNPAPLSGSHGAFTGATTYMVIS